MGARGPDTHSVAHRYALFLCSLDDNLIGQLTIRPSGILGPKYRSSAGTFWGVLNVSLRASGAQLGYKLTWNHKKTTWIMKIQPGTLKNHKN